MRKSWALVFGILLLDSCVDRIFIDIPAVPLTDLAVDGQITDDPGPYTVKLSLPIQLDGTLNVGPPVSVKKVTISDDAGTSEVLTETSTGTYKTSGTGIRGTIGRSYTLTIVTNNGKTVTSTPEKLTPVGAMDSLYYEFTTNQQPDGPPVQGYNIYVDGHGLSDNSNYIRWRFSGTYAVSTIPQYHREATGAPDCPACGCQLPPACSGWALVGGELKQGYQIDPKTKKPVYVIGLTCTCCDCWVTDHEQKPVVASNQFVAGSKFPRVLLAFVPANYYTLYDKYKIVAEQLSISKAAFDYYRAIQSQKDGTTSLFQPVTGKIPTNLSEETKTLGVSGIFIASSIKRKKMTLTRATHFVDIPDPVNCDGRTGPAEQSCLLAFPGATTERPADWN